MERSEGFLHHIEVCSHYDLDNFTPFVVDGMVVGAVTHDLAKMLVDAFPVFQNTLAELTLSSHLDDFAKRSAALAEAAIFLSQHFKKPLRIEKYPVLQNLGDEPLAEIDRVAVPWFGVRGFGVHVNGYVKKADGLYLWVAERAMDRQVDPGKLDNIIGGGLPIGLTPEENLVKESWEEAGVDEAFARTATACGTLSYKVERMNGLRNDTLFIYDMEMPDGMMPRNTDGEVASFQLMPLGEVAAIIRTTDRFKFNCNLVIIDFMLRHDFITSTHDEYDVLVTALQTARGEGL